MANKINSNVVDLRYAEEVSLGVLNDSAADIWEVLYPNGYTNYGGTFDRLAREVIDSSRMKKEGSIVDQDVTGGFSMDLTQANSMKLYQGFLFNSIVERPTTAPLNSALLPITNVDTVADTFESVGNISSRGFIAGHLIKAYNFDDSPNNGLMEVDTTVTADLLPVTNNLTDDAAPDATAYVEVVGYRFADGTLEVVVTGDLPVLSRASGAVDFTTIGLSVGDQIYIGGDAAASVFATAVDNGLCRVSAIAADAITLDKTFSTMTIDAGTSKLIEIYFGNSITNGSTRRSYQFERSLGDNGSGTQYDYLVGAVPNELTINIDQADLVRQDLSFVCLDYEPKTGAEGAKAGTRPSSTITQAFNTSSHFNKIRAWVTDSTDSSPTPLNAYFTDMRLNISNGVTADKAIGTAQAIDLTEGYFMVSGDINAYFNEIDTLNAISDGSRVTLDIALFMDNAGIVYDITALGLGDGQLNVEKNVPIKLPLSYEAFEDPDLDAEFIVTFFKYLPTIAM